MNIFRCLLGAIQRLKGKSFPGQPAIGVTFLRWATLILYGWLAALVVYPLLPWLAYTRPEQWLPMSGHPSLHYFLMFTYALVAVLLVLYLQTTFFIRLPRRQFKCAYCLDLQGWLRYPTLHLSVLIGLGCLFYLDGIDWQQSSASSLSVVTEQIKLLVTQTATDTPRIPLLDQCGLWVALILYGLIQVIRLEIEQSSKSDDPKEQTKVIDLASCSDEEFEEWLAVEQPASGSLDFFDREPYVARIKKRIEQPLKNGQKENTSGRGQIILGEFGSGKTTIINMVEKQLSGEWIVSYFDCWQRSGNPSELAAQFMEQIIHDVGQQIEAASLARLPDSFAHALYGSSHWFSLLDAVFRPDTPEELIQKLNSLLSWQNRKLLIVVENVDRNKERDLFVDVIAAILDKISGRENIRFIFSADEQHLESNITYRISDYRERIATVMSSDVIARFMAICLKKSMDSKLNGEILIIPYLAKGFSIESDSLNQINEMKEIFELFLSDKSSGIYEGIEPTNFILIESFSEILSTPRILKYVLRHVYDLWTSKVYRLAGEVNLFDLLIYSVSFYDGKLKEKIKEYDQDILSGNGDSPFISRIRKVWNKDGASDQDIPEADYRDFIAFYLLNGNLNHGLPLRDLCQPIIEKDGIDEDGFKKYKKVVDIGQTNGYVSSDQEFLRDYTQSCLLIKDDAPLKKCLDYALINPAIFKNLLDNMTRKYYSSVEELYQFTYNALILADLRYAGNFSSIYIALFDLCFNVMNFDRNGGGDHAELFQSQLKNAFQHLDKNKQYSFLLRVMWHLVGIGKDSHYKAVVKNVIESVVNQGLSERMGQAFSENHPATHELQYEYISFLPELEENSHLISEATIKQVAHSFLLVNGMKLNHDPKILADFFRRYESQFRTIKNVINKRIGSEITDENEKVAWEEILRLSPIKSDDPDSE